MSGPSPLEHRILVFAPTGRDASLTCELLGKNGIGAEASLHVKGLCASLGDGAGAILVAEEALSTETMRELSACLQAQPTWSDLPVMILASSADLRTSSALLEQMLDVLGNVTLLERPIHIATLMTSIRAALRARQRQYAARESLRALMNQESALKLADQRKDEFLAMLAHELRNPMAAISTALTLMERVQDDATRSERFRSTARRQMKNLVRLVDDLLDVSRITRGMVELRRARMDLGQAVQNAISAARPSVEERKHALKLSIAPGPWALDADATRIEQVIANLLSNAAKYTPPGGRIEVSLSHVPGGEHSQALLRVEDTGRGIPPHMLGSIFDLFVQVDPGLDRSTGGLGLGLTLVKQLVEMHGGSVAVHSEGQGKGSAFEVRLPLSLGIAASSEAEVSVTQEVSSLPRRRIVLVEDSDDLRDGMRELLTDMGHEVEVASNGIDGVALILAKQPDIALVDVGLPGISGYEVARQVRAHQPPSPSLLVSLTGYGGPETRDRSRAAGFDRHLTKPLNLNELPGLMASAGRAP